MKYLENANDYSEEAAFFFFAYFDFNNEKSEKDAAEETGRPVL
jgi:hypothetical protein